MRREDAVVRLAKAKTVPDGTVFHLVMRERHEVSLDDNNKINKWLDEDPINGRATWINASTKLRWHVDGQDYLPTSLVNKIVKDVTNVDGGFNGPAFWRDDNGATL